MKVTLSGSVPTAGTIVPVVQVNVPVTGVVPEVTVPPENVDEDRGWPEEMVLAVGKVEIVGVALFTVTVTDPVAVL